MEQNNKQLVPEPMSEERQKRIVHLFRSARELMAERGVKVETEHIGLQASIKDGVSLYLHAGTEDISVEQQIEVMTPDAVLHVSFQPHSLSGKKLGLLAGSIYRVGKKGVYKARSNPDETGETLEQTTEDNYAQASDTEVLSLSVFLSKAIRSVKGKENKK